MWYWIIKVSILSFIFIFLIHYLYSFFISTLTIPKVKDLVTLPQQKYDELFNSLQNKNPQNQINPLFHSPYLPSQSQSQSQSQSHPTQSMKDELIKFMKELGSNANSNNANSNNANKNNISKNETISSYSFSR